MSNAVADKTAAQPKASPSPFGLENFLKTPPPATPDTDKPAPSNEAVSTKSEEKTEAKPDAAKDTAKASADDPHAQLQAELDKKNKQLKLKSHAKKKAFESLQQNHGRKLPNEFCYYDSSLCRCFSWWWQN